MKRRFFCSSFCLSAGALVLSGPLQASHSFSSVGADEELGTKGLEKLKFLYCQKPEEVQKTCGNFVEMNYWAPIISIGKEGFWIRPEEFDDLPKEHQCDLFVKWDNWVNFHIIYSDENISGRSISLEDFSNDHYANEGLCPFSLTQRTRMVEFRKTATSLKIPFVDLLNNSVSFYHT